MDSDKKVMAAMSGGVDSSVAAAILLQQGYEVTGVTMQLFCNEDICITDRAKTCCSLDDVADARSVADKLGFTHYVFNLKDRFLKQVVDKFADSYLNGLTPNPCIDCNRFIKFDALLHRAAELGIDRIATGHYAKIVFDATSGRYLIKKPEDLSKDQTYVLYSLTQEQLSRTLFPLGGMKKTEVRLMADKLGLTNWNKPDSQDICFVKNGDYVSFIEKYTGRKAQKGEFTDAAGNVLGTHNGIAGYTVGQRKGLGIAFGKPLYVTGKDPAKNRVILGELSELYTKRLYASDINLIALDRLTGPLRVYAKSRYRQKEEPATIHPIDGDRIMVEFDAPHKAPAPGQAVVFYDGDVVVGGGTITGESADAGI